MNKRTMQPIVFLLIAIPALASADVVQATYHITASDFDNGGPPQAPTSNFVEGYYTVTFDTSHVVQTELIPDAVTGLDIVDNNGITFDYDETNSGLNTEVLPTPGTVRLTIGGSQSSVAFMAGLSNDFRVQFDVTPVDYSVVSVFENMVFVTTVDAYYSATVTSVELIAASIQRDTDVDGLLDSADNCVQVANANQRDTNGDGIGNRCDPDFDQSCVVNFVDLAIMKSNIFQTGDLDTDLDGDGNTNFVDLSIMKDFFFNPPGPGLPGICP